MGVGRTNSGSGGGYGGLPNFTYTGSYDLINEGRGNWRLKLLTSGTLVFTSLPARQPMIDLFLVGGGGGGGAQAYGGGGGGGYTKTQKRITPTLNSEYTVTIGAGGTRSQGTSSEDTGTVGGRGGTSSAFGYSAEGGYGGGVIDYAHNGGGGGNGGSGGSEGWGKAGGSDGGNGVFQHGRTLFPESRRGYGQGTTTREFGELTGDLYAGGGGCNGGQGGDGGGGAGASAVAYANGTAGAANTGGGGGAGSGSVGYYSGAGGSGIVVIRNYRA